MTSFRLLVRNLFYHWRGNLAVLLGIALGAAVLTGALLVGDSLRGSLKTLTLEQLGWVDEAMVPGRFFRVDLAKDLAAERHAAALLLRASATFQEQRVGRVNVVGVDASFWPDGLAPEGTELWSSNAREVALNRTLATALGVKVGDKIKLNVEKADHAPRETLLGNRRADAVIEPVQVTVRAILADEGMARFSLKPTPEPVRNAFVPIGMLHKHPELGLAGKANTLLVAKPQANLAGNLHAKLTLADWGLRYMSPKERAEAFFRLLAGKTEGNELRALRWRGRVPEALAKDAQKNNGILTLEQVIAFYEENREYSLLESERMLLEPMVVNAVKRLAPNDDEDQLPRWKWTPILVYLADTLKVGKREVPYAIIAGDDDVIHSDEHILLTEWSGSPWKDKVKQDEPVEIQYFAPDAGNHLQPKLATFKVLTSPPQALVGVFDDPDLTPAFPGVTDMLDISDWTNPPFPYDPRRTKGAPEEFWKRYRTTPQAYVSLKKAQELWKSRFGEVTSIQFRLGLEHPDFFAAALLKELTPEQGGFVFQPIKAQAVAASSGATDFGVLFLSFSFFLIVAALLLVGLLVRLNLDRRASEMGVLLALGWTHTRLRWLLLGEGAVLAWLGSGAGLLGATVYARLMLQLLSANWPGGDALNFLGLHAEPVSFAIGFAASLIVTLVTLWWALRVLGNLSPLSLLRGNTSQDSVVWRETTGWAPVIAILAILIAGGCIYVGLRAEHPAQRAAMFFLTGALLLMAAIAAIGVQLGYMSHDVTPQPSLVRLGVRNACRQRVRSLLTVGLLASASFVIVAVESFHQDTDQHFHEKSGGSGGFAFVAEGNVPVFEDLNQAEARRGRLDTENLRNARFFGFRVQPGDDASCLNLYKPLKPRVLGATSAMIQRGGFSFAKSQAKSPEEIANPWLLLEQDSGDAIPAILDAETAQWILKVQLGETIEVRNDLGQLVKLRIVALLHESIFQSELLVCEANFLKLYPRQEGFAFFLVDLGDAEKANHKKLQSVESELTKGLADFNLDVQSTAGRLQGYLAVRNMYLATFQALGGLGLVLGAAGLAIVLLRGVWERRAELALLLALGFRPGQLAWLVLVENAFLLALGLAAGTLSAMVAVSPHLIGAGAQVLWLRIGALLLIVLAVGLTSAALAVWSTLKTPVLTALRRE